MVAPNAGSLLIVDDEPSVRRALKRLLRNEGYAIFSAADAAEAERVLDTDAIDVIVCDQDMPGQSGIEFLSRVAPLFPQQRRLMISGRFQSDDVAQAIDSGAVHKFMMKPWDDAILKADLRSAFKQVMASFADGHTANSAHAASHADDVSWLALSEDRKLSSELHKAASDGSLSLQYQPQIDLAENRASGLEALLRWDSSIGAVSPDRFIGLAERSGVMPSLTHWVACEVCYRAKQWASTWPDVRLGLNISPIDLRDDKFADYLTDLIAEHQITPRSLQIEVTESQALDCDQQMIQRLNRIAAIGVELAIDDFGAGATTISYLAALPFTTLKLDRSLTLQLDSERGQAVVEKVLEMAKCLGMKTTVEGIETSDQAEAARSLGADTAQGYFFSKPIHQREVLGWIDRCDERATG